MLRTATQLQAAERAFAPCPQDRVAVRAWIESAHDKACDADNGTVSLGTRFEAAYDAAFFLALAVLNAAGWKHRAVDGHHAFVLEAACAETGASTAAFDRLDAIRDVRNQKYAAVERTAADLRDARAALAEFSDIAADWLKRTHPSLLA